MSPTGRAAWHPAQPFSGDPMADWLSEVAAQSPTPSAGPETAPGLWQPSILFVPPLRAQGGPLTQTDRIAVLKAIAAIFALNPDGDVGMSINEHDLYYWIYSVLHYPDQTSELIVFVRRSEGSSGLEDVQTVLVALRLRVLEALFPDSSPELSFRAIGPGLDSAGDALRFETIQEALRFRPSAARSPLADLFRNGTDLVAETHGQQTSPTQRMLISAVIDHGIPSTHPRFSSQRKAGRVLAHWKQGAVSAPVQSSVGPGVVVGKEVDPLAKQQDSSPVLNRDIQSPAPFLQSGDNPQAFAATHGALVLDLAAGRAPRGDDAEAAPWHILAVDLPPQIVRQTNGAQIDLYVKSALNWIFYKALDHVGTHDVSIVLTYAFGGYSGRRDGQGLLDCDFQIRLERGELAAICVASGNGFLEDIHADLGHDQITQEAPLELVVPPASAAPTFVQIWLDQAEDRLPFALHFGPPGGKGAEVPELPANQAADLKIGDRLIARAYYTVDQPAQALPLGMEARRMGRLVLAIMPSARSEVLPVGRWTMRVSGEGVPSLPAWIERSDAVAGFPNDRKQARFEHPSHRPVCENGRPDEELRQDGVIRRAGTLNDVANATGVIAVAAYRGSGELKRPALYSAAGAGFVPRVPDLSMIAEFSDARRNRLATGTNSATRRGFNGTSAAAALAARAVARILLDVPEGDTLLDFRGIKQSLMARTLPVAVNGAGCGLDRVAARHGAGVVAYEDLHEVRRAPER